MVLDRLHVAAELFGDFLVALSFAEQRQNAHLSLGQFSEAGFTEPTGGVEAIDGPVHHGLRQHRAGLRESLQRPHKLVRGKALGNVAESAGLHRLHDVDFVGERG